MIEKIKKSNKEWREILTPGQYEVMRRKGTEAQFSGKYYDFKGKGIYRCAACGNELFSSEAKYDCDSGWPSFYEPISEDNIEKSRDTSLGMLRIEVACGRCGAHLGHVFDDGPPPTGKRYCINSISLDFVGEEEKTR